MGKNMIINPKKLGYGAPKKTTLTSIHFFLLELPFQGLSQFL